MERQAKENGKLVEKTLRGKERVPYGVKVGDTCHGFKLQRVQAIQDYNVEMYELEHEKTGARYLHLDSADLENAFAVLF